MNIGNRILFNTMILYSKIIITMFISLFTVPIIMNSLGISDFGLYNLIAGVIIMLAFLNASMTVSTQRYMSIGMGVSKNNNIKQIFNVSLVLHIIIGLFIILLFEIGSYFLFDGNLNIDTNRIYAAKIIYQFLVISTFFSILSVPFDAIINAHENMLALSILEIIESILKLLVIVFLIKTSFDKLIFYGFCLAIISIFVTFLKWLFCLKTYPVCKVELKKSFNLNLFIEMFGFAGWNTFGAVAMLARNQGIAIILNIFFGTVINASYAIANQINGVISNFSSTIQKSFNPQLMKSEGENNRTRMLMIASFSSKLSVFIFSFMAIPIIIEMPFLLKVWLKQVPENTLMFCRLTIILTFLIQYSSGLMSAIQSIGKIKTYTLTISTLILLNIPIDYFLLKNKLPGFSVMICAIFIEILTLATRIYFANKLSGLSVRMFINNVILKSLFPIFLSFTFCWYISSVINEGILKLLIIGSINAIILIILIFNISLANDEKKKVISLVMFLKQKLCKS